MLLKSIVLFTAFNSIIFSAGDKSAENSTTVIYLTATEFRQKIFDYTKSKEWKYKGTQPAIIDFYADWCRPCKMLAPIIEEISKDYKGKIIVYKVNTDKEKELASAFSINSIPSVLFIPMNGKPQMNVGYMTKAEINGKISEILKVRAN